MKPRRQQFGSKPISRAQKDINFLMWLSNCRDQALDWPAVELARSYGMTIEDVTAHVAAEKVRRANG
jgi:hypothetical protein